MQCKATDGVVLCQLPSHVLNAYPVEPKHALRNKNSHIGKTATQVLDLIMTTHGNGNLCAKLLCNTINRSHLDKCEECYAYNAGRNDTATHVDLERKHMKTHPPLGDTMRDFVDEALSSIDNKWGISDKMRHTREMQGVGCEVACAVDHAHEVTKNYHKKRQLKATALWDISNETGQIASAVLAPTTKVKDLSHAALQVARRPTFEPKALCSDTWPAKLSYWMLSFGDELVGRLGLFHCIQRITKTLRKSHIDHFQALNHLLQCIYVCHTKDYEELLRALREGTLNGEKHSVEDVAELKASRLFRQRYKGYLRKVIRPPETTQQMLEEWFVRCKCTASEGSLPAQGRRDPISGDNLFTAETKSAVQNCKEKAQCLQDPLPLEEMYDGVLRIQTHHMA